MQYRKYVYTVKYLLFCLLLNACASNVRAPVVTPGDNRNKSVAESTKAKPRQTANKRANSYIVQRGDTLYSIAWNYGRDYRELARWNNIKPPYVIYPGRRISLTSVERKRAEPSTSGTVTRRKKAQPLIPGPIINTREKVVVARPPQQEEVVVNKIPKVEPPGPQPAVKQPTPQKVNLPANGPVQWSWPVNGRLVNSDTPISQKGIDIAGRVGQEVNAAGPGQVVYSGSGLLGYGRLIIIKHNDTYLSAYAHNSKLLVNEGDFVRTGQNIAQMGQTSNGRTLLHFEIRKNGKPVDPLVYLPKL